MNTEAAHVICDHPEHPAARAAASKMLRAWILDKTEQCWRATWASALTDLYNIVEAGGGSWGMGRVTEDEAATVRALIDVGGWWESEDVAIPPGGVAEWVDRRKAGRE